MCKDVRNNEMFDDDDALQLTPWGCMMVTLEEYGIHPNLTPKMGEHLVEDFMALLCDRGYAVRSEDNKD